MTNTNETIADIIAEMRGLVKPGETLNHTYELLNGLADRIEAARKREKAAIEADALDVGGFVEASRSTTENSSEVGDAAKLRKALVCIKTGLAGKMAQSPTLMTPHEMAVLKRCEAALAAPRKNCERFQTWDEAKDAYWREQGDPCDWRKLGAWLFALEGGAK